MSEILAVSTFIPALKAAAGSSDKVGCMLDWKFIMRVLTLIALWPKEIKDQTLGFLEVPKGINGMAFDFVRWPVLGY